MSSQQSSFKVDSSNTLEKIKQLVHEGNIRRITVKHDGEVIAEFPLTAGVIAAAFAPPLAAIGAIIALVHDCTIEVHRTEEGKE